MSGTSLDGVDAAIIKTDGGQIHGFGPVAFRPYSDAERELLQEVTNLALAWGFEGQKPDFSAAVDVIHRAHIEAARKLIAQGGPVDVIGFHGQTLLHQGRMGGHQARSLQIGDGQKLAEALGTDVVYDFRAADIAAGGQGAPLVPVYHQALVRMAGLDTPVAVLNIGGVANLSLMDEAGIVLAGDCGPGNGPLDDWVSANGLGAFDAGGRHALAGTPDMALVADWLSRDFFVRPAPKSLDRHDFDVLDDLAGLSPQDGAATLCAFTVAGVEVFLKASGAAPKSLIVCGGGVHNAAMMAALQALERGEVLRADTLGWKGDALEAQAFAYLAVRNVKKLPITFPQTTGVATPCVGGVYAKAESKV